MRAFIAIEITDQAMLNAISGFQKQIGDTGADVKMVEPQNMHFTLLFLGEISDDEVSMLNERLSKIRLPSFEAELAGTGVFPNMHRINVVWIGVNDNAQSSLKTLAQSIVSSLSGSRFKPDKQFEAHLTVARVKSSKERARLLQVVNENASSTFGRQLFTEFKLKKSDLTSSGPVYSDIGTYKLV